MPTTMTVPLQERLPGLDAAIPVTITEQFNAYDAEHPWIYNTLESLVKRRLRTGATRVSVKALFEVLRWDTPDGVTGLNNNFTALYARKLVHNNPQWADAFAMRRRRSA
ncbi:hypothetical protein ACFVQ9_34860 [Streptomyces goshikiensis]|uniref:hypothetical protein n=1 Tax=Streptomyces goshikiensis TaxID=1942 RepID=UPI0036A643EA